MAWLDNANTIASLVLAIFGISGYIFGISTYLRKKATPIQQSSPTTLSNPQISPSPRKSLSWLEWTELFVQSLLSTADFVITFVKFPVSDEPLAKLGSCAVICLLGSVMAELILAFVVGLFLSALGLSNAFNIAGAINTILLFMAFSFLYIYHVGLLIEKKQREHYQEIQGQPLAER